MILLIALLISYFLGAIPSGFILGKILKKIDIREHGSKSIGATNVLRTLGVVPGIISLIFDFFKGFFAVEIGRLLLAQSSEHTILGFNPCFDYTNPQTYQIAIVVIGLAAIIGHIYPVFLRFKGGKGMATGAGVYINLLPIPSLIAVGAFLIIVALFRYVSLASVVAVLVFWVVEIIHNIPNFDEIPLFVLTTFTALLIIYRHKENIGRLRKGEESKISFRRKK